MKEIRRITINEIKIKKFKLSDRVINSVFNLRNKNSKVITSVS